jgi:hypothetical protein
MISKTGADAWLGYPWDFLRFLVEGTNMNTHWVIGSEDGVFRLDRRIFYGSAYGEVPTNATKNTVKIANRCRSLLMGPH